MRCLMAHNASLALHENEKHIKVSCRCKAQFCQNSECKSRIWFLCPFLISYTNWHNHSLAPSRGRKKKTTTSSRIFRFVTDRWVGNCKTMMMRLGRVQRVLRKWLQRARVEPTLPKGKYLGRGKYWIWLFLYGGMYAYDKFIVLKTGLLIIE